MNETFNQYKAKVAQLWTGMGKKQKVMLGATAGVLIITVVLLTMVFSKTEYELAFQDLDSTDAAAVMSYLDSNSIPYELANSGRNILVPAANAEKVKVEAGSQGLVQNGSIGFESFASGSTPFGSTDREFDVKYRSALNGEIQRLLNGMNGVQKSNVLITLPEESAFLSTEDAEPASASIMITFKPGYRPTQKEVDGYYNLVKTSVPKLAIENITISSAEGELTASNTGGADSSTTVESHFQIQKKYESEVKRSIQQTLGPIVGLDNMVVNVSSSFNFDKKKTDEQLVKPLENNNNNGIIVSEATNSSSSTGTSGSGGVAGTGSTDVPGYQATTGGDSSSSEENSRTTNYEFNRINNQIESAPYVIKDLSISVAVDKSKLSEDAKTYVNDFLSSLVRAQLRESGQNVDDDAIIGKKISISGLTFLASDDASETSGISMTMAIGIGAAALVIIGALGFMLVKRRRKQAAEQRMLAEEVITPHKIDFATVDLEMAGNDNQMRKQLETLAKNKPEEFVNLLRTWLADE
ncbi:flagellar basal-body MS-ring/collar protein FliF [Paenibacillus methanolicus]|uniref:Flagellar M-ring protein n=1 Tax=Paenibacillus methanolicus TaxID=582686 RepID=A0A5S5CG50_9BACL|nr:flagellar basal-body MS-ring/collar protein FliF [Paenibacillus methanolicus]TYP77658.1 flagellar M-ring protein FliF [Paenibacillus methanolicus]